MLMAEFGPAFTGADVVILTDIYAAGEDPIEGVTFDALAANGHAPDSQGIFKSVREFREVPGEIGRIARPGDLIVLLGAGSIGSMAGAVLEELGAR